MNLRDEENITFYSKLMTICQTNHTIPNLHFLSKSSILESLFMSSKRLFRILRFLAIFKHCGYHKKWLLCKILDIFKHCGYLKKDWYVRFWTFSNTVDITKNDCYVRFWTFSNTAMLCYLWMNWRMASELQSKEFETIRNRQWMICNNFDHFQTYF